jgi:hypothetical protein
MTRKTRVIIFSAILTLTCRIDYLYAENYILCSSESLESIDSPSLTGNPYKFWDNGSTLNVYFLDGDDIFIKKVSDIANEWTQYANLKFAFHLPNNEPSQSHIRITFKGGLYQSCVGKSSLYCRGQYSETMQLGNNLKQQDDSEIKRVVLHEFGHAIGL